MIGIISKKGHDFFVNYGRNTQNELLIINNESFFEVGKQVEFEIIDEFTNPEMYTGIPIFEGKKYAKIKSYVS